MRGILVENQFMKILIIKLATILMSNILLDIRCSEFRLIALHLATICRGFGLEAGTVYQPAPTAPAVDEAAAGALVAHSTVFEVGQGGVRSLALTSDCSHEACRPGRRRLMLRQADARTLPRYVADPSIWGVGSAIAEVESAAKAEAADGSASIASVGNGEVGTDGSVLDLELLAREWAAGWAPQFTASAIGNNGDGARGMNEGVGKLEETRDGGVGADAGQNGEGGGGDGGGSGGVVSAEVEDISSSHGRSFLSMFSGGHHSDDGTPTRPSLSLNRSSSHGLDTSFTEADAESFGHALAKSVAVTDISKVVPTAEEVEAEADEEEGGADEFLIYDGAGSDDDWGMVKAIATPATVSGNGSTDPSRDQKKRTGGSGETKQTQPSPALSMPSGAGDAGDGDTAGDPAAVRGKIETPNVGTGATAGAVAAAGVGLRGDKSGWLGLDQDPHLPFNGPSTVRTHDVHAPRKFGIEVESPLPRRESIVTASVTMVLPVGAFNGKLVLFDHELFFIPHRPNRSCVGSSNGPPNGTVGGGSVSGSQSWQDVDGPADGRGAGAGGEGGSAGGLGSNDEGSGAEGRPVAGQEKWMVRKLQGAYLRRYRLRDTAIEIFSESIDGG